VVKQLRTHPFETLRDEITTARAKLADNGGSLKEIRQTNVFFVWRPFKQLRQLSPQADQPRLFAYVKQRESTSRHGSQCLQQMSTHENGGCSKLPAPKDSTQVLTQSIQSCSRTLGPKHKLL